MALRQFLTGQEKLKSKKNSQNEMKKEERARLVPLSLLCLFNVYDDSN